MILPPGMRRECIARGADGMATDFRATLRLDLQVGEAVSSMETMKLLIVSSPRWASFWPPQPNGRATGWDARRSK